MDFQEQNRWIWKYNENKGRLVAQGYTHIEGIDFNETFALVAKLESIKLLLAIAHLIGLL